MQRLSLNFILGLAALVSLSVTSCTRINGINNNQVVEVPYSLYFADSAGALYNSNNGKNIKTIVQADGRPSRAISVSGNHILWAKNTLYVSVNNGVNFNRAYDSLNRINWKAVTGFPVELNQSMLINVKEWGTDFATSADPSPANYLGIVYSLNVGGIAGSWWLSGQPDTTGEFGLYGPSCPFTATSFTFLPSGTLCCYDAVHNRNAFKRPDILWKESTGNPTGLSGVGGSDQTGTPLPVGTTAADSSKFTYGHYNDRLVAVDTRGMRGAWYSDDKGRNWSKYGGIPANTPLLCVCSPFEEVCLVGSTSGLYRLNVNTGNFEQNNKGLGTNLIIRSITFKQDVFKNGEKKRYVYLASNQGIYQSTDMGASWVKTVPGNFVAVY